MGHYRSEMYYDDDKEADLNQLKTAVSKALNAQAAVDEILGKDPREESYKFLGSNRSGYTYGHIPCGQIVFDRDTHLKFCPANPPIEEDPL